MSEILFEKELVRKTANELGMHENKIQHHMNFMKDFVEELMHRDDVHSIHFPHIGIMYRNIKGCSHVNIYLDAFSPEFKTKKRLKIREKNNRDIKYLLKELESFDNFSLHNYKRRIHNPYFTCIMKRAELEKFQNVDK